jgi:hypothetical protein
MSIVTSEPFDCASGADDDTILEILPCVEKGPQWWQIGRQVAWSFAVWFILVASSPAIGMFWNYICDGIHPFWVQEYVGTRYRNAHNLRVEQVLCFAQFFGSLFSVWMWVIKSYSIHNATVSDEIYAIEMGCVLLSFSHTLFERVKFDFSMKHALSFAVFLDCLTLPPLIMQKSGPWAGGSWLTLGYLRAYHCLTPIMRLVELDFFEWMLSDFTQQCIISVLECIVVVFSIAGTFYVMESLGDIKGFSDQFIDAGMGEISFFQMVYFTFVTISTVGFGDYSPTTVLSRIFIIFAILGGVTFFSYISVHIVNLVELESSGRGQYYPSRKSGRGHILVMGGGVTCGSQAVIETFMRALCRDDKFYDTPDIVLMGQTSCSKEVRDMMKCEWTQQFRMQYFLGSPLNENDMKRVRASEASMVFILSDFQAPDTNKEDNANSLIAASVQETLPSVQYRLMLCSVQSLKFCSDIGLSEFNCFSLEALKAGMLGTSHGCPGFSTMVLNLGLPILNLPNTPYSSTILINRSYGKWLKEYAQGCALKIFGFHPIDSLVGLTFKEMSIKISEISNVVVISCQIDGALVINPSNHIITSESVLFGLGESSKCFFPISKDNDSSVSSWIQQFKTNRQEGSFKHRLRSRYVHTRTEKEIDLFYETNIGTVETTAAPAGGTPTSMGNAENASSSSSTPTNHIGGVPVFSALSDNFTFGGGEGGGGRSKQFIQHQHAAMKKKKQIAEMSLRNRSSSINTSALDILSLKSIVEVGGHTVVILLEDPDDLDLQNVWEQLSIMIDCMVYAKDFTSLVIVHTSAAMPSRYRWMKKYENELKLIKISFCVGDVLDPLTLQGAGCHTCSRIITLAPSAPEYTDEAEIIVKSDEKMDENNIFLVKIFNQYQNIWKRSRRFRVIFDWYSAESMNILPVPLVPIESQEKHYQSISSDSSSLNDQGHHSIGEESQSSRPALLVSQIDSDESRKISQSASSSISTPRDKKKDNGGGGAEASGSTTGLSSPSSHRKVAPAPLPIEGRPSSPSQAPLLFNSIDAVNQGIKMSADDIEFARHDPRGNCRFAAGDTIPKSFIAGLYSMAYYTPGFLEFIEALLMPSRYDQKSLPCLLRVPSKYFGKEYSIVARELLEAGVLPLGLLRPEGIEAGTPFPYVVTLVPSSNLTLTSEDSVYVLADPKWANEEALKLGYGHYFEAFPSISDYSST